MLKPTLQHHFPIESRYGKNTTMSQSQLLDQILDFRPEPEDHGQRLDQFLSKQLPHKSRVQIQGLIKNGNVLIDQESCKASYRLKGNENIRVLLFLLQPSTVTAEPIPLEVIYEDNDLAVVNKRAGMIVHQGAGVRRGTLVNALLYRFRNLSQAGGGERPGIVHRLDKQTSGLMVIARNDISHRHLAEQFRLRHVIKKYLALVHGVIQNNSGDIKVPIGRDRIKRIKMTTWTKGGRQAHTSYRVLERFGGLTFLEVGLHTGRTHQIRVHLSSTKHPVVGDTLYGAPTQFRWPQTAGSSMQLGRYFLHASFLGFNHPRGLGPLEFSSSLPEELERFLERLRCHQKNLRRPL